MNLNDRITEIIAYSNLSSSEFADQIEVQRSNISHITSGRNKPSLDFLIKIKDRFPELDWDWLIYGSGEMTKNEETETSEDKPKKPSLPDLFSLIDDENFGRTESEDRIINQNPPESDIPDTNEIKTKITDSQPLEKITHAENVESTSNQSVKVKKIVLFYENGKFESFEP